MLANVTYRPYGARVDGRYLLGFAGREEFAGLLYFGARYYLPGLRVFASPDSLGSLDIESPLLWSRYGYAAWNPVRYADDGRGPLLAAVAAFLLSNALDIAMTIYDAYQAVNDRSPWSAAMVLLDLVFIAIPGSEGAIVRLVGKFVKAVIGHADEGVEIVKFAAKYGDDVIEGAVKVSDEALEWLLKLLAKFDKAAEAGKLRKTTYIGKAGELKAMAEIVGEGGLLLEVTYWGKKLPFSADFIAEVEGKTLYVQVKNWREVSLSKLMGEEGENILDFVLAYLSDRNGMENSRFVLAIYTNKVKGVVSSEGVAEWLLKNYPELEWLCGVDKKLIMDIVEVRFVGPYLAP